ncbi:unnamed protein product [Durusdinium trenchii]|uniref:Uncharacterized protein n=1 Tax=Durusdinium trenchii TaxID=1381693 RepID=A0ABP0SYP2_9DINO
MRLVQSQLTRTRPALAMALRAANSNMLRSKASDVRVEAVTSRVEAIATSSNGLQPTSSLLAMASNLDVIPGSMIPLWYTPKLENSQVNSLRLRLRCLYAHFVCSCCCLAVLRGAVAPEWRLIFAF